MIIVHENNAPAMQAPAPFKRTLKVLLSPAINPELESIAAGLTILPPGGKSDDDKHVEGEMFYVISGKGWIRVGKEEEELTLGTAIWVPPGVTHQLLNNSNGPLKILWVLSPPGREAAILKKALQVKNNLNSEAPRGTCLGGADRQSRKPRGILAKPSNNKSK